MTGTTATWVTLPLVGGSLTVNAGDDILAVAGHFGGATEVRFGLAQNTYEGSVIGYTALGELFSLTSPGAVMIRLLDDPSVSLDEVTTAVSGINVFPNPANNSANVSIELSNDAAVAINVTDLSGKVVYTTDLGTVNGTQDVQVNTSSFTSGVYMVNVSVDGAVSTQKLVVRK